MIIRTVTGDIAPEALGITLDHDHLITRPPAAVTDPDLWMDDEGAAIKECQHFHAAGGCAIVEMTTVDYGRDAAGLARISSAAHINIITATGFNKGTFADRLTSALSSEQIAAWMIGEIGTGVCGTSVGGAAEQRSDIRCGVIKASSSLNGANCNELKVFDAAIRAHHATGAPISTHTEKGTWAIEQATLLLDGGVVPEKILIGHLDLKPDLSYLCAIAATGVNLSFDQFGKEKYLPDRERLRLIATLVDRGYGRQVMLGGDMARRSYFVSYHGGPGLAHIPGTIAASLHEQIGPAALQELLIDNPRRWLAFAPRADLFRAQ
jgi:phosphotriesterase-related protein